jgi:hypothetical protein
MKSLNRITYLRNYFFIITALICSNCLTEAQVMVPRRTNLPNISGISRSKNRTLNLIKPQTITATQTQSINFGTYCVTGSSGGTVTVGWNGSRTSTGDIFLLNTKPVAQPAIFEIKLSTGRSVSFRYAPTGILNGSNGGSLTFDIGPSEYGINGSTFTVNSDANFFIPFNVGGTLYIPANAIQGTYSGNFDIIFNQE